LAILGIPLGVSGGREISLIASYLQKS